MVTKQALVKWSLVAIVFAVALGLGAPLAMAQEHDAAADEAGGGGLGAIGLGIGAAWVAYWSKVTGGVGSMSIAPGRAP